MIGMVETRYRLGRLKNNAGAATVERMLSAPRCGAKCKRTGLPCRAPAMRNGRCRLHGGKSTGARTEAGKARQRIAVTRHGMYCAPGHPIYDQAGPYWRGWAESRRAWRASAHILATAPETRDEWGANMSLNRGRYIGQLRDGRGRFRKPRSNEEMAALVDWE